MTWPAGQKNGRMFVEQFTNQAGLAVGKQITPAAPGVMVFPWYEGGYTKAQWYFDFALNQVATIECKIGVLDSDANPMGSYTPPTADIVSAYAAGALTGGWWITWDDSPIPGNQFVWSNSLSTGTPSSNPLNPFWNKGAFLALSLSTPTAGTVITITTNQLLLAG